MSATRCGASKTDFTPRAVVGLSDGVSEVDDKKGYNRAMKKVPIIVICLLAFVVIDSAHAQQFSFVTNLSLGSSGQDVSNLQTLLINKGFDIPAISNGSIEKGYFGGQTKSAVIRYQLSLGLPATGYFGPMTRARLRAESSTYASSTAQSIDPISPVIQPIQSVQSMESASSQPIPTTPTAAPTISVSIPSQQIVEREACPVTASVCVEILSSATAWRAGATNELSVRLVGNSLSIGNALGVYAVDSSGREHLLSFMTEKLTAGERTLSVPVPQSLVAGQYRLLVRMYETRLSCSSFGCSPAVQSIKAYDYSDGYVQISL
jgi:peptidoglycan hydrolase-like protein with peptidoglycan-binding domain